MARTYHLLMLVFTFLWANVVSRVMEFGYTKLTVSTMILYLVVIVSMEFYCEAQVRKQAE